MSPKGALVVWAKENNKLLQHKITAITNPKVKKAAPFTYNSLTKTFINCDLRLLYSPAVLFISFSERKYQYVLYASLPNNKNPLKSRKDICAANDNSLLWKMQIVFSAELSPAKLK